MNALRPLSTRGRALSERPRTGNETAASNFRPNCRRDCPLVLRAPNIVASLLSFYIGARSDDGPRIGVARKKHYRANHAIYECGGGGGQLRPFYALVIFTHSIEGLCAHIIIIIGSRREQSEPRIAIVVISVVNTAFRLMAVTQTKRLCGRHSVRPSDYRALFRRKRHSFQGYAAAVLTYMF